MPLSAFCVGMSPWMTSHVPGIPEYSRYKTPPTTVATMVAYSLLIAAAAAAVAMSDKN